MKNYAERKQRRLERYAALVKKNLEIAEENSIENSCGEKNTGIPFGQPILVGHHSEGRHRAAIRRMENRVQRGFRAQAKAEYYQQKIASAESNAAVSSDNPDAIVLLEKKIAMLENEKAELKAAGEPYQYVTTQIRNAKKRLEYLKKHVDDKTTEKTYGEIRVVDNVEENRLQLFFPGKPAEEIRRLLKSRGFRWSPRNNAWQAYRNNRARWAVENIIEKYHVVDTNEMVQS